MSALLINRRTCELSDANQMAHSAAGGVGFGAGRCKIYKYLIPSISRYSDRPQTIGKLSERRRLDWILTKTVNMPAVTIINAPPLSITPEEYREATQATPSSFSDIPPVLRHNAENIRISFSPPIAELSDEELNKGSLYVIERYVNYLVRGLGRAC